MYQELIDKDILARDAERQSERGSDAGEWHPSSLTGCPRKAVYDFKGYEPSDPKDIRNIRIMDRGTEIHQEVQGMMIRETLLAGLQPSDYRIEVKVDTHGIKGSVDAILQGEVQEYKSISPQGKKFMKPKPFGKDGPGNEPQPKPEHVKQARIYQRCLKEMGEEVTDFVRIVYFDRDDWSVLEFVEPAWDDIEWYEFLSEIGELEDHVEDGTLPGRMPLDSKGNKFWLCRYCDYRTRCWEIDE